MMYQPMCTAEKDQTDFFIVLSLTFGAHQLLSSNSSTVVQFLELEETMLSEISQKQKENHHMLFLTYEVRFTQGVSLISKTWLNCFQISELTSNYMV